MSGNSQWCSLSFTTLIQGYQKMQASLTQMVRSIASSPSAATPGKFLMLQFAMANVAQMGESISNVLAQVNTVISGAIKNQRTQ